MQMEQKEASIVSEDDIKTDNNNKTMRSICRCLLSQSSRDLRSTLMHHTIYMYVIISRHLNNVEKTIPNRNHENPLYSTPSTFLCV